MTQTVRNAIYGVAASIGALLIVVGWVSETDVAAWLEVAGSILTLASTVLATVFSRTSATTTLPIGTSQVEAVLTSSGLTIAGPASTAPQGTVLG